MDTCLTWCISGITGWPQIPSNLPASASHILGRRAHTYFLSENVEANFKGDTQNDMIRKEANRKYQEGKSDFGMKARDFHTREQEGLCDVRN